MRLYSARQVLPLQQTLSCVTLAFLGASHFVEAVRGAMRCVRIEYEVETGLIREAYIVAVRLTPPTRCESALVTVDCFEEQGTLSVRCPETSAKVRPSIRAHSTRVGPRRGDDLGV